MIKVSLYLVYGMEGRNGRKWNENDNENWWNAKKDSELGMKRTGRGNAAKLFSCF